MHKLKLIDYDIQKNIFNILLFLWVISIPFKNALFQISLVSIILFFLIYIIKNKDYNYFKMLLYKYKDLLVLSILILLCMTISNYINYINDISNKKGWIDQINYLYRYIFIFIILIYFYSKNFFSEKTLIFFILIALSIQVFDGVFQSIFGHDLFKNIIGSFSLGLTGATSNRNTFGFFMGLGVVITAFLISKNTIYKKQNFILIFLFILFIYCTLFSYTRTTWLSLSIVFLLYVILNLKDIKLKYIIYFSIFLFILCLLFFNINTLNRRFTLFLEGYSSNRYEIWLHALKLIEQKLIFGWGLDSWKIVGLKSYSGTHNSILEILLYLGVFGLVIYTVLVYFILKEIYFYKQLTLAYIFVFLLISTQFGESITSGKTFLSTSVIFMFFVFRRRVKE